MVRPSVPRFLREGDKAELKVVVNNAADRELSGELRFALADPDTGHDLASEFGLAPADLVRPFKVAKGGSTNVGFALTAPRRVGMATLKVTAVAGNLSDGELRPLPVLPSRVHLTQSRFVSLTNRETREMKFPEMAAADPTRLNDQLVVTRRRAALSNGAAGAAVPGPLPVRMHGADAEPVPVDGDRLQRVQGPPGDGQ